MTLEITFTERKELKTKEELTKILALVVLVFFYRLLKSYPD